MNKKNIYEKITQNVLERYQKRYYELGEGLRMLGQGCLDYGFF